MKIPRRHSLVSQTYDILLEAIRSGSWEDCLPGERNLCEQFQISRFTLRQALKQLERERVLASEQGMRRRIILKAGKDRKPEKQRSIGYLCSISAPSMPGYISRNLAAIERIFHASGVDFKVFSRPGCFTRSPAKALKQLIEETNINYWILQQAPIEQQRWFKDNRVPAIISGSPFEEIGLPFVDLDNAAVCRHAVGRLIARKRKSICFLAQSPAFAGDIRSEAGFMEAVSAKKNLVGKVVRTDGTPENIRQKIKASLASKTPPDAFLVDKSSHAYTVVSLLMSKGIHVPKEISVICRTESIDFPYIVPSVAHYSRNIPEVAKRTAELALKLVNGQKVGDRGVLLIPDFVPGESL